MREMVKLCFFTRFKISFIASFGDIGRLGKITSTLEFLTNFEFLKICALFEFDDELNP